MIFHKECKNGVWLKKCVSTYIQAMPSPFTTPMQKINAINDTNLRILHICIDRFGHFSTGDKEN